MNRVELLNQYLNEQRRVRDELFTLGVPTHETFLIALGRDRALQDLIEGLNKEREEEKTR